MGQVDVLEREVPEDGDDTRTLPVEVGATRRRFWSWRSAVNCSVFPRMDTTPKMAWVFLQCAPYEVVLATGQSSALAPKAAIPQEVA